MTINSNDYTNLQQTSNLQSSSKVIDKTNSLESVKGGHMTMQAGYD